MKNIVNQKEHDFLGAAFFKSLIKKFAHEESYISIPLKRISLVNPKKSTYKTLYVDFLVNPI